MKISTINPFRNLLATDRSQRARTGYSIAEILLVFGSIAGVLIGVWAMYTMLGDKSVVWTAMTEIQIIKKAAHKYKYALGRQNRYKNGDIAADMDALKPYLGQSGVANGQNIFGATIVATPLEMIDHRDLQVKYGGIRDLDICRQILNYFGEVVTAAANDDGSPADLYIEMGKTISGYVGGIDGKRTGCHYPLEGGGGTFELNILID